MTLGDGVLARVRAGQCEFGGEPASDPSGDAALLAGRIDNRDELRRALRIAPGGDSEFVLRAWQAWGPAAFEKILGEFAGAIWVAARRELLVFRDAIGIYPLYYRHDRVEFTAGLTIAGVLGAQSRPNPGFLAELLCDRITSLVETEYADVFRLPAAHYLIAADSGIRAARYWSPPENELAFSSEGEAVEALRDVMGRAIRLRAEGRYGFQLSGGLDSTAVLLWAFQGGLAPPETNVFSLRFPGRECDESPYIDAVLAAGGWRGVASYPAPEPVESLVEAARRSRTLPDAPNTVMMRGLLEAAAALGLDSLFTGQGGDDWFSGVPDYLDDLVRAGRFREAWRLAGANPPLFGGWRGAARRALRAAMPEDRLASWLERRHRRGLQSSFLHPEFVNQTQLPDRLSGAWRRPGARASTVGYLTDGAVAFSRECMFSFHRSLGMTALHPFYDRRVVEWGIRLPESAKLAGAETKRLVRAALRPIAPGRVVDRRDKADFGSVMMDTWRAWKRYKRFSDYTTVEWGWVSVDRVVETDAELETEARNGQLARSCKIWELWHLAAIEAWLEGAIQAG